MERIFNPKFFTVLRENYSRKQFLSDALAGIVVGIVALPLAIAFAVASEVSPERGILTAIFAGFIVSLLGGSRVQIAGPTGAFIVIVLSIVNQYGLHGLIISTVIAGILLIVFGLLKLGNLLKYFPHPLVVGFTSGIAVVILSTQFKDALGLEIGSMPSQFVQKWAVLFQNLNSIQFYAPGITVGTILIIVFSKKIVKAIPGSIIAIILGILTVYLFHLPVVTIEIYFGEIPRTFSIDIPEIDISQIGYYFKPALTIALLGAIKSLLSAVVADGMIGSNHRSNTELIAQGIANIVTPFFGGIPATGAIARTATNIKNGGRTPVAGMVHAFTLLLITLFFARWVKLIPMPVLAGILIVVVYNMSEWRIFRFILKGSLFDVIVLLTTFFLTVLVDLTVAIEIGIVLSSLLFMKRMADMGKFIPTNVDSDVLEDYSSIPKGIVIYEISGPLFFASAKEYCEVMKNLGFKGKVIIIRMRHVPFIDSTGLNNLKGAIKILLDTGTKVVLSGVNDNVRADLNKAKIDNLIGESNIYTAFDLALVGATNLLHEKKQGINSTLSP